MRPLKFRAYNTVENRMYLLDPINYPFQSSQLLEAPAWKVMQYTGLKDKNEKEIYEGDIIYYTNFYEAGGLQGSFEAEKQLKEKVEWDNACAHWTLQTVSLGVAHMCDSELEIIGNIYETPELLN